MKHILKKCKKLFPLLLFLTLSGALVFSWFREGYIYGGGDVGLQTYNPQRILENARFVWWESTGPGAALPQGLSAVPFQFGLYILQLLGFSPLALQFSLFFLLLASMGFGMHLFLKDRMEEKSVIFPLIGGLFYMLNPYMMVQVWHRFIHTTILLAAALPFFAMYWTKWVSGGRIKYLTLFLLASFLAVYAFGTYAFIVTVWVFLFLLTIPALIPWSGKKAFFVVGARFIFGFAVWILLSCWWIFPVINLSPAVLSAQHQTGESLETLVHISAQAILPYSLQLINPFYLFYQEDFGAIYKNTFFQIIPWIFTAFILIGLSRSFKTKAFSLFGIFFLISIFLAKGAAPPFGYAYMLGFKKIFALGVLRNPFEKTGLILVFFATILFILGIKTIAERFKKRIDDFRSKTLIVFVLVLIVIFSWPMFVGQIFGRLDSPAFVRVPDSYRLTDQWLGQQKKAGILDGKVLHLPLTRQESLRYNWEFGYNGLEPSDTFFTAYPSISRGFNIQRVDDSLTGLSLIFGEPYSKNQDKILSLLQAFNVRFIVLHKDLNWRGSDVGDPLEIEKVLNSLEFIQKKEEFGDLIVYQISDKYFGDKIEFFDSISLVYPQEANMTVWPWLSGQGSNLLISPIQSGDQNFNIASNIKEILVFPNNLLTHPDGKQTYDFWINYEGEYELLTDLQERYAYINTSSNKLEGTSSGSLASFGEFHFKQGVNKISFTPALMKNLVYVDNSIKTGDVRFLDNQIQMIVTQNNSASIESTLGQIFGSDVYEFGFEAFVPPNLAFDIEIIQDTDQEKNNEKISRIHVQVPKSQSNSWQGYKFRLPPLSSVTREASVKFSAKLENSSILGSTDGVLIRNLSVVRVLSNNVFLRGDNQNVLKRVSSPGQIAWFKKVNPVEYEGEVSLQSPGFILFKETYHPDWELKLTKEDQIIQSKKHYLGFLYGNAWSIEEAGNYKFKIIFKPQQDLYFGMFLSGIGILSICIYAVLMRKKG